MAVQKSKKNKKYRSKYIKNFKLIKKIKFTKKYLILI